MKTKGKVFVAIGVVAFAIAVAFNINTNFSSSIEQSLTLANIEALANGESGGYSCSATSNCYIAFGQVVDGSVSCTGVVKCERGYEWVKCDGKKTTCWKKINAYQNYGRKLNRNQVVMAVCD